MTLSGGLLQPPPPHSGLRLLVARISERGKQLAASGAHKLGNKVHNRFAGISRGVASKQESQCRQLAGGNPWPQVKQQLLTGGDIAIAVQQEVLHGLFTGAVAERA